MKICFLVISLIMTFHVFGQDLSGTELLEKTIAYHDPSGNWNSFIGTLNISMETPKGPKRDSEIKINIPHEYFYVKAKVDTITTEYEIQKNTCSIKLNQRENLSEEILKKYNLSCERANLYKNYYTYLYGLPMKLKDPGTHISEKVLRKKFKGKEYLVLKVSYDESVGKDIWFFYFDPETFAMEIYQFFKGDPENDGKDTGEYILLTEEITINGIKMPKVRAWYYNKDDKYLGTDFLN